jgi:hypothetical protein
MDACPRVSRTNSPQNSWIHCSKKWEKIEDSKVRAVVFKIWHTHTHTHILIYDLWLASSWIQILTQQYMQGKSATSLHSKNFTYIWEYHKGVSKAAFSF